MFPYLPHTPEERRQMLQAIGVTSTEELYKGLPSSLQRSALDLPEGASEWEVARLLEDLAGRNTSPHRLRSFLGGGASQRFIPSAARSLSSRSEFSTAYTPYQPEISQGTLQGIYEYQSLICLLTGMDVANASQYDGGSALAEAAFMAIRLTGRTQVAVAATVHPEYRQVLRTYAAGPEVELVTLPYRDGLTDPAAAGELIQERTGALILQMPNFFGCLEDIALLAEPIRRCGGLLILVVDPLSLGLLRSPGEWGADIAVGDGQVLGNSLSFGGPSVGFLACQAKHLRQLPGRIAGMTTDNRGQRCFTLTLQTREQHIRREKATSNICTNQALNALSAAVYLSLLGKQGLQEVAHLSLQRAHYLAEKLAELPGISLAFSAPIFNEFVLRVSDPIEDLLGKLRRSGILGGLPLSRWYPELTDAMLVAVTECNGPEDLEAYVQAMAQLQRAGSRDQGSGVRRGGGDPEEL